MALAPTVVGPYLGRCAAGARVVIGEIVLVSSAGTAVAFVPASHYSRDDHRRGGGGSLDAAHRAVGLPGSSHAEAAGRLIFWRLFNENRFVRSRSWQVLHFTSSVIFPGFPRCRYATCLSMNSFRYFPP